MQNTQFVNVCLALIVGLLALIALKRDLPSAYAAERFTYEIIRVTELNIVDKVAAETQAGWEPVAVSTWAPAGPAQGVVIFRKPQ
jgi:hypothetical protein